MSADSYKPKLTDLSQFFSIHSSLLLVYIFLSNLFSFGHSIHCPCFHCFLKFIWTFGSMQYHESCKINKCRFTLQFFAKRWMWTTVLSSKVYRSVIGMLPSLPYLNPGTGHLTFYKAQGRFCDLTILSWMPLLCSESPSSSLLPICLQVSVSYIEQSFLFPRSLMSIIYTIISKLLY